VSQISAYIAKLQSYTDEYREYISFFQADADQSLPFYIREGGNLACIALRLKAPALRLHQRDQPRTHCVWCMSAPECGRHIVSCSQLPADLCLNLNEIRGRIVAEARFAREGVLDVDRCLISCIWPNATRDTLRDLLLILRRVLAAYRRSTPVDPDTRLRPVWPLPAL
jgi:hypothetical protein